MKLGSSFKKVLILVVVEEGGKVNIGENIWIAQKTVLILVVVEEGGKVILRMFQSRSHLCLNPCCGGRRGESFFQEVDPIVTSSS